MKKRYLILPIVALLLSFPSLTAAQDEDDIREAQRRVEEARKELVEALAKLRAEEATEARRRIDEAVRALQRARMALDANRLRVFTEWPERFEGQFRGLEVLPGGGQVFTLNRPRMGVIVATERRPGTDSIGAVLTAVTPGAPADEAGLEMGDVIVSVNGERLARADRRGESPGEKLIELVRESDAGDTLHVVYQRNGSRRTSDVVLRELGPSGFAYSYAWGDSLGRFEVREWPEISIDPDIRIEMPRPQGLTVEPLTTLWLPGGWLDMELTTIDSELGSYFGVTEGILVVRAPRESSLDLKSGDVMLSIDGRVPTSPSHALRIMRSYEPGETMRIEVMRDKRRTMITATVPERDGGLER